MPDQPTTVPAYLAGLPKDRRDALATLRKVIRANLDPVFKEGIQYRMPGYFVPLKAYPPGYHCDPSQPLPYLGFASQKNHMALYAFCVYTSEELQAWFRTEWTKTGKKLDMGKSCIRFKSIDDVPLEVIGKLVKKATAKKFIAAYEASLEGTRAARTKTKTKTKTATRKTSVTKKKTAAKKKTTSRTTSSRTSKKR